MKFHTIFTSTLTKRNPRTIIPRVSYIFRYQASAFFAHNFAHIFGIFRSFFIFAPFFDWLCYAIYEVSDFSMGDSNSSDDPINILSRPGRSKTAIAVSLKSIRGLHTGRGHGDYRNAADCLDAEFKLALLEAGGFDRVGDLAG